MPLLAQNIIDYFEGFEHKSRIDFIDKINGVQLYMKRDDLLHETISGNKFRKLKYVLKAYVLAGKSCIVSMGGAYSNHLRALAAVGKVFGITTIGIVRGKELANKPLNRILEGCKKDTMRLEFVSREDFRAMRRGEFDLEGLLGVSNVFFLPEGGKSPQAIKGCSQIITDDTLEFDTILCSVGTGTMLAGIASNIKPHQQVIGFSSFQGDFLQKEITQMISSKKIGWQLNNVYHFGGYAKSNKNLLNFIDRFKTQYQIELDRVYNAKSLFGILDLIQKQVFQKGSRLLYINSGGYETV